jgi:hypothetical protein
MSLERRDLTQLVTFDPPLPRVAFAIKGQGTTTDAEDWGGSGMDGKSYSWFLLDTTWWVAAANSSNDLNLLPIPVGTQFQVYSAKIGALNPRDTFSPESGLINSEGAPDLIDMNTWLHTVAPTVSSTGAQVGSKLRRVVGVRQAAGDGSSWYIYFTPTTDTAFSNATDGIVTWPEPRNPQWMGSIGHVTGLSMNWSKPGGPTSLQFNLTCPPNYRTTGMSVGRRLQAYRGGSCIWDGILEEPQASPTGWTIIADGVGTEGANYAALYSTWTADNPVNEAIGRGLRWRNDGIGSQPGLFGLNASNVQDSGSLTITDFLNLLVTSGALYWSIEPPLSVGIPSAPWVLRFREFPTDISGNALSAGVKAAEQWNIQEWQRIDLKGKLNRVPPDLFLVNATPVTRTINGTINTLVCKYQSSPDITAPAPIVPAKFLTLVVDQPSAVATQGRNEFYLDLSTNGVMTAAQVQVVAQNLLAHYVKASFSTAYQVSPGRLLNNGGVPVDLAIDYSGKMVTVLVENAPVGGDVSSQPLTFFIGDYSYDDDSQSATVTPYQNAGNDISSLLARMYPTGF